MAESLKMSITGYSKIERGITDVNYSRLEQIAIIFEMEITDIIQYGDENAKPAYKVSQQDTLEAKEKEIVYLKKIISLLEDKLQEKDSSLNV